MIKGTAEMNTAVELSKIKQELNIDFTKKLSNQKTKKSKFTALIYGSKKTGKTTTTMLLPGRKLFFSFDGRTRIIYENLVDLGIIKADEVTVIDVAEDFDPNPELATKTGFACYDFLLYALKEEGPKNYDWHVYDGLDFYNRIAEMRMRYIEKQRAYGTIDLSLWKKRSAFIASTHKLSLQMVKKGVVYTNYYDDFSEYEFKDENGNLIQKKEPKYMDLVKEEIDFLFEQEEVTLKGQNKAVIRATVTGSPKDSMFKTGEYKILSGFKPLITDELLRKYYPHLYEGEPEVTQTPQKEEKPKTIKIKEPEAKVESEGSFDFV